MDTDEKYAFSYVNPSAKELQQYFPEGYFITEKRFETLAAAGTLTVNRNGFNANWITQIIVNVAAAPGGTLAYTNPGTIIGTFTSAGTFFLNVNWVIPFKSFNIIQVGATLTTTVWYHQIRDNKKKQTKH